jgi:hypothetical protein
VNEDHECVGELCIDRRHRSEEVYRIGGLRDDLDAKDIIVGLLVETGMDRGRAIRVAEALMGRLLFQDPTLPSEAQPGPIFITRLYEVERTDT